ncbi:hypothetical protein [Streptomyces xantholiticus]|uniref:hypothetical protein n=1 Tax=Streptomyces xantholiticus TaxID=68285 RepID=UPI001678F415|nr:hypothetical protein [Streptomyces xantholiticus]GGW30163.1 hypothetical protein GCM10010381_13490 [Streptomyces xantholiticus]
MTQHDYVVRLTDPEHHALQDLADAQETTPEALLREAARHFLDAEGELVRTVAARFTADHAELVALARADRDRAYDLVVPVAAGQIADPAVIGRELRAL